MDVLRIHSYKVGTVFLRIFAHYRAAIFARSLLTKNTKRLPRKVFDVFARHAGHVHDVTDTDLWAQIAALKVVFSAIFRDNNNIYSSQWENKVVAQPHTLKG